MNFHVMLGSLKRRSSQEIGKILSEWVNPERNLSNSDDVSRLLRFSSRKAQVLTKSL